MDAVTVQLLVVAAPLLCPSAAFDSIRPAVSLCSFLRGPRVPHAVPSRRTGRDARTNEREKERGGRKENSTLGHTTLRHTAPPHTERTHRRRLHPSPPHRTAPRATATQPHLTDSGRQPRLALKDSLRPAAFVWESLALAPPCALARREPPPLPLHRTQAPPVRWASAGADSANVAPPAAPPFAALRVRAAPSSREQRHWHCCAVWRPFWLRWRCVTRPPSPSPPQPQPHRSPPPSR